MNLLAVFSAGCSATSLIYYLAAGVIAMRFARRAAAPPPALPKIVPRVAVLKPLQGLDPSLPENLMSYLELDYGRVEYFFGVSSYEDPAAGAVVALKPRYPFVQSTLVVGEEPGCANGKIAKLIGMARRAPRAEIFLLSDADVSVERDHLQRVVAELCAEKQIGLVTCLYRAKPSGSLPSRFEALVINTDFAPLVMVSNALERLRYALGASIAIKRDALEAIGGFHRIRDVLADDYYLGKFVASHGYQLKLSNSIVTVHNAERRFAEFWHHQLRWARTFRTSRPISVTTIILHGPFWALVLLATARCSPFALGLFACVIGVRIAVSRLLIGKVLGLYDQRGDAWLVPLKDLVITAVWAVSLFGNRVIWSGRRLRIQPDGTMHEVFD